MISEELQRYRLSGVDLVVGAINVSQTLTLQFHDADQTSLQINGTFSIEGPHVMRQSFSVDQPTTLGPVFAVLKNRVEELCADKVSGDMTVRFIGGLRIDVPGQETYEAWELYNSHGLRVIALPGGQVAYWSAVREAPAD